MNLEEYFLKSNKDGGFFNVICAGKGSGKSHLFLSYFKLYYHFNVYDLYVFILPELNTEADDKYNFLRTLDKVIIYTEYDKSIFDFVKMESKTKRIFLVFDDATASMFKNKNDDTITQMASTTRHGKSISLFLITHALSNILLPHVRGLIDHLFIGVFGNMRIIKKQLYEENLSMVMEADDFLSMYRENILSKEDDHPFMYLNRKRQVDWHVNKWQMLEYYNHKLKPNGKAVIKSVDKDRALIQKIKDKQHVKELKDEHIPKPVKFCPLKRY